MTVKAKDRSDLFTKLWLQEQGAWKESNATESGEQTGRCSKGRKSFDDLDFVFRKRNCVAQWWE